MRNTKLILLFLITLIYTKTALSGCIQNPNFKNRRITIPAETIYLQYDAPNNIFYSKYYDIGPNSNGTTQDNNGQCGQSVLYHKRLNQWTNDTTNISGVKFTAYIAAQELTFLPGEKKVFPYNDSVLGYPNGSLKWRVEIRKQGEIKNSASLTSGAVSYYYQTNTSPSGIWDFTTIIIPPNFNIVVLNCSLKQTNYNIELGDWYDTQFKNIGDISHDVDIPINLSCMTGTNIKTTLTASNIIDAASGKIGLNGADKASGIAIQLVDRNNKPIPLGVKQTQQNSATEGDYIFGWKAHYIKTNTNIAPGTANATATVNVRYE